MTRELAAGLMLALLVVALLLAWWGWRHRVGRHRDLPELLASSEVSVRPQQIHSVLYVATTQSDAPLERIARRPLAFRARVNLGSGPDGLWLDIAGEDEVFIPSAQLIAVGRATWTIDRVVDSDGLIFVRWQWGEREVDSYFRSVDFPAEDVQRAVEVALSNDTKEDA
jgi:hypothetical protein